MTAPHAQPDPERVLAKAVLRAAEVVGLRAKGLAAMLGTSEASLSRLRSGSKTLGDKERELALLFVRAFRSLDALLGGDTEKMRAWFGSPNTHLGGLPADRVTQVEGLIDVVHYLDAMRGRI